MQGLEDLGTSRYNPVIKVHQSQKLIRWERELTDCLYLVLKGEDAMLVHLETKKVKEVSTQDTLLQVDLSINHGPAAWRKPVGGVCGVALTIKRLSR